MLAKLKLAAVGTCLSFSFSAISSDFQLQAGTDQGLATVIKAQEMPAMEPTIDYQSAEDQLNTHVNEKYGSEGWDPNKQRMIAIHAEQWDTDAPEFDPHFASKRSLYMSMAVMGARAKIAEFMRTEMSAKDMLESPPNDVFAELQKEIQHTTMQLKKNKKAVEKLAARYHDDEAKALNGADWSDRSKALMDAIIGKLDEDYDAGKLDEKAQKRFERTKNEYAEALEKMEALEQQAEQAKGSIANSMTSTVETLARGAVVGSTVIATAESWDEENEAYQVAAVVVWSPKLKESAEAMLTGKIEKIKPKPGRTVSSWLKKQDFSTLIGPRQIIDENGTRWFTGAYAEMYQGSSSTKRAAKARAELFAKKEAAMAIFANLETQKQAVTSAQTINLDINTSRTNIASSFAEKTSQAINNINISGGSVISRKEVKHGVTGVPMYVVVYAVSANSAVDALKVEQANYASAINIQKHKTELRGQKAGMEQALEAATDSKVGFNEAAQRGKSAVQSNANAVDPTKSNVKTPVKPANSQLKSKSVINVQDIDDEDF